MTINRWIRVIAGSFILLSLALGVEASPLFVSKHWLWFTAFVGVNLFQSGITQWCLMEKILSRLGVPVAACCCGGPNPCEHAHGRTQSDSVMLPSR